MKWKKTKQYKIACAEMHTFFKDGWRLIGEYPFDEYDLIIMRHPNGKRLSIRVDLTSFTLRINGILKKAVYV